METCANCGRNIGNLEEPRLYLGKVVCPSCCSLLESGDGKPSPEYADLRSSATTLCAFANVCFGLSCVLFFCVLVVAGLAISGKLPDDFRPIVAPGVLFCGFGCLGFLLVGAFLSTFGRSALVIRDIAKNASCR